MSPQSATGPLRETGPAPQRLNWRERVSAVLYGLLFFLLTTAILALQWPFTGQLDLKAGDVSPDDIRAPASKDYISSILTQEMLLEAESNVPAVYEPQRRVRTDQVRRSREIADFVDTVRADSYATTKEKLGYLQAIPDLQISEEDWQRVLDLEEAGWFRVKDSVPVVLNNAMSTEIRDNQLTAARRAVANRVDLEEEAEAQVAILLVRSLIRPNTYYNAERTEAARQEARAAVQMQKASYEQNEIIVRQGDILNERHIEALEAFGLTQPTWQWSDLATAAVLAMVLALIFGLFIWRDQTPASWRQHQPGVLLALVATFLILAKFMVPGHALLPYVFPLAALTMLVHPLLGLPVTFLISLMFSVVIAVLTGGSVPILVYSVAGPLVGALILGRAERTSAFVRAGAAVSVVNLAILAVFNLPFQAHDLTGYAQLAAAGLVNGGLAASVTLIGFYLLGAIFDIATPLRLMELARPNHPLLRDLIMKTPGTYHHSLLVSNLAEQAAEAIGADAFLCRVGAYYHDIGKMARPYFFVENRVEGTSPHDQLDPWSSAQIIISHVKDGLELAQRHKLPRRLRDFVVEHQGTGLVTYFYHEAQKITGENQVVDESDFRYPGPKPQSKETAILMLADSCESAVRAARPESQDVIDEIVRKIINQRLIEGQLSDCDLTLRDLEMARRVFVRSLQGVHHPRIKYPETKPRLPEPKGPEPEQPAPLPAN